MRACVIDTINRNAPEFRIVVSTAAFHAGARGLFLGLGGFKKAKLFLPHPHVKLRIVGSLRDREVACSASDLRGLDFAPCVWRAMSSHLTILSRFSWPNLPCMRTNVA